MREIFALSYGLLCALMVLQALALRHVLRKAAALSRLYSPSEDHHPSKRPAASLWRVSAGARVPEFSAPLLGTDRRLTRSDLEGKETVLLFVSPADAHSPDRHQTYHRIAPAFKSMWESVEGEVYLVCRGSLESCRHLIAGSPAKAILDESEALFEGFGIDKTPRAVQLDEQACVIRYGEPEENADDQVLAFSPDPAAEAAASYRGNDEVGNG